MQNKSAWMQFDVPYDLRKSFSHRRWHLSKYGPFVVGTEKCFSDRGNHKKKVCLKGVGCTLTRGIKKKYNKQEYTHTQINTEDVQRHSDTHIQSCVQALI